MKNANTVRNLQEKALRKYVKAHLDAIQKAIDKHLAAVPMVSSVTICATEFQRVAKENGYLPLTFVPFEIKKALEKKGYIIEEVKDGSDELMYVTISW